MFVITVIIGLILGAGWMTSEYNYRASRTKNRLLRDRVMKMGYQIEQLHKLLDMEKGRVVELESINEETLDDKAEIDRLESEIVRLQKENARMEHALMSLRDRAKSKEYLGNALGKVIISSIDKLLSPNKEEAEKLSESAKDVFRKAKKAINS